MIRRHSLLLFLLFSVLFVFPLSSLRGNSLGQPVCSVDSIPVGHRSYQGFRLHLVDLALIKQKDNEMTFRYTAINTGREDLRLGKTSTQDLSQLVIAFDDSFENGPLFGLKETIISQVPEVDLAILAGDIRRSLEMTLRVSEGQNVVQIEASQPEGEVSEANEKSNKIEGGSFSINTGEEDVEDTFDANTCPDIFIEGLRVLKKSKHTVTIEYILSNQGLGPANIQGSKKGTEDNVAFKALMSSSPKLSRGDIVIGGGFIPNLGKKSKGMLDPDESYTGTVKLDIRNMTRFTPYIILELDPYQSVRECDETNNKNYVKVR